MTGSCVIEVSPTYAELYPPAGKNEKNIALLVLIGISSFAITPDFPKSKKYLYQDATTLVKHGKHLEMASPALKFLSLIPQRIAFAAGRMPVVLFDPKTSDDVNVTRREVMRTWHAIDPAKRPQPIFYSSTIDNAFKPGSFRLANTFPVDGLEPHEHLVPLDLHYELLSKLGLAESGLVTPRCSSLITTSIVASNDACCDVCLRSTDVDLIPTACKGTRKEWLLYETERILDKVRSEPMPFVLKFQQTVSGAGTYIILNETQREELVTEILPARLAAHLPKLNSENAYLKPAHILITELVEDIVDTLPLTFFIQADGNCVFICCAEQDMDEENHYAGATITYSEQEQRKQRLEKSMYEIGAFLYGKGYIGPVGADILEDKDGKQWIVDLNVRSPSSLILGTLKKHFTKRGLDKACLLSRTFRLPRDQFEAKFQTELYQGRLIIAGWADESASLGYGELVLGAKDAEALERLRQKIDTESVQ